MKHSEKKLSLSSPVGYSFMLTIIIILTLVVFAVLSLSTALRDQDYSMRAAEKTTAYYEANSRAYGIWAQADSVFQEGVSMQETWKNISALPGITVQEENEDSAVLSYAVEINSSQELRVSLEVNLDKSGKPQWRIQEWREVSSGSWEGDAALPVIGGSK